MAFGDGSKLALEAVPAGANGQITQVLVTGQSTLGQLGAITPVGCHAVDF
jgi:hypothetical protein